MGFRQELSKLSLDVVSKSLWLVGSEQQLNLLTSLVNGRRGAALLPGAKAFVQAEARQ
jgi:hypothetical protein